MPIVLKTLHFRTKNGGEHIVESTCVLRNDVVVTAWEPSRWINESDLHTAKSKRMLETCSELTRQENTHSVIGSVWWFVYGRRHAKDEELANCPK